MERIQVVPRSFCALTVSGRFFVFEYKERIIIRMKKELPKTYDPSDFEERIYSAWCRGGYFTPKIDKSKPHYTIAPRRISPVSFTWGTLWTTRFRIFSSATSE